MRYISVKKSNIELSIKLSLSHFLSLSTQQVSRLSRRRQATTKDNIKKKRISYIIITM